LILAQNERWRQA